MSEKEIDVAKRIMNSINTLDMNEAEEFINNVLEVTSEPPVRVPENVFKELFLPVFSGQDVEREKNAQNFISHWMGLVGSASAEAEVVNINGEKIFTVPPIVDTSVLKTTTHRSGSQGYAEITQEFQDQAKLLPGLAIKEFSEKIGGRISEHLEKKPDPSGWVKIFQHYNLIPKSKTEEKTESDNRSLDEDFDF